MHLNICVRFKKSPKSDDLLGPKTILILPFLICVTSLHKALCNSVDKGKIKIVWTYEAVRLWSLLAALHNFLIAFITLI